MVTHNRLRAAVASLLASVIALSLGCVNLDKRRTQSTKAPIVATQKAMQKAVNSSQNSFMSKVKSVLPKKKASIQIQDQLVADDDPTRLSSKHADLGPDLYIAAARLSERNGRYDHALQQYNMALKSDGRNRNALIGLARLHHRGGNMDAAIRVYQDALNIYRSDAVIMNDLGLCYARNKQLDEAISVLQAATQAAPNREMYLNNLAAALVEANRTGEAMAHLSKLHGPAVANYNIGYLLDRSGRPRDAVSFLDRALSIDPNFQQAKTLLATITPQISSLPKPHSTPRRYEIPVTVPSDVELKTPEHLERPAGEYPAVTPPAATPSHLENPPHRFGPFGFVPKRKLGDLQLVSYVEDDAHAKELQPADEVRLFALRQPERALGGTISPPLPSE